MKNIGSLGHYSDLGMRYLRLIVVMITSLVLSACDFPSGSSNDNPNSNPELPAADTTPPIIAFIAPEDGETLTDRRPVFTLAYSDNVSINTSFLIVLVNGQANTLDCSISLTTAECAPFTDLALGDYSIVASIADISGNGAATEINIKIEEARDTVAPTLMITAPTDGSSSTNSRPDILVSYSDETGLDLSTFTALFDGEDVTERCLIETEGASCVTEEDYAVGTHTVAASIQDLAGNEATNSIVFSVDEPPDTNSPSISIDTPSDGAILTDRRPTLIISFTDDREIDTSSFSLFLNDQELKSG